MSSCQPQRYELLPNCNVWIAILIYGGGRNERTPCSAGGRQDKGVGDIYYIRYRRTYTLFRYLFQYEDVGQKRSHLAIIEPIPHRF